MKRQDIGARDELLRATCSLPDHLVLLASTPSERHNTIQGLTRLWFTTCS